MNTGVHLKLMSVMEFFIALIAREFGPWLVQMYVSNVFFEVSLFTINPIAMFASVLQALMDTLYVPFQIGRFC